eukprot:g16655.t1
MAVTFKDRQPDPPSVLVVTDGWAGVPGVPNHSTPGKKVVTLPDDTDAKPGGDDSWQACFRTRHMVLRGP